MYCINSSRRSVGRARRSRQRCCDVPTRRLRSPRPSLRPHHATHPLRRIRRGSGCWTAGLSPGRIEPARQALPDRLDLIVSHGSISSLGRAPARSGLGVGACFRLTARQATVCAEAYSATCSPAAARYGALADRRSGPACGTLLRHHACALESNRSGGRYACDWDIGPWHNSCAHLRLPQAASGARCWWRTTSATPSGAWPAPCARRRTRAIDRHSLVRLELKHA